MHAQAAQTPNKLPNQSLTEMVYAYRIREACYINLTNRCTLRCAFCPKFNKGWTVKGHRLRLRSEPEPAAVLEAIGDPRCYQEIVFCGLGESTLRLEAMQEVADQLKPSGVRLRLNTDGLGNWVHDRDITPELGRRFDALSVSLNAQNEAVYDRHCRPPRPGSFPALLGFVERVREQVPEVTLTAVNGLEGVDMAACEELANQLGAGFRRRVLDQVG